MPDVALPGVRSVSSPDDRGQRAIDTGGAMRRPQRVGKGARPSVSAPPLGAEAAARERRGTRRSSGSADTPHRQPITRSLVLSSTAARSASFAQRVFGHLRCVMSEMARSRFGVRPSRGHVTRRPFSTTAQAFLAQVANSW